MEMFDCVSFVCVSFVSFYSYFILICFRSQLIGILSILASIDTTLIAWITFYLNDGE